MSNEVVTIDPNLIEDLGMASMEISCQMLWFGTAEIWSEGSGMEKLRIPSSSEACKLFVRTPGGNKELREKNQRIGLEDLNRHLQQKSNEAGSLYPSNIENMLLILISRRAIRCDNHDTSFFDGKIETTDGEIYSMDTGDHRGDGNLVCYIVDPSKLRKLGDSNVLLHAPSNTRITLDEEETFYDYEDKLVEDDNIISRQATTMTKFPTTYMPVGVNISHEYINTTPINLKVHDKSRSSWILNPVSDKIRNHYKLQVTNNRIYKVTRILAPEGEEARSFIRSFGQEKKSVTNRCDIIQAVKSTNYSTTNQIEAIMLESIIVNKEEIQGGNHLFCQEWDATFTDENISGTCVRHRTNYKHEAFTLVVRADSVVQSRFFVYQGDIKQLVGEDIPDKDEGLYLNIQGETVFTPLDQLFGYGYYISARELEYALECRNDKKIQEEKDRAFQETTRSQAVTKGAQEIVKGDQENEARSYKKETIKRADKEHDEDRVETLRTKAKVETEHDEDRVESKKSKRKAREEHDEDRVESKQAELKARKEHVEDRVESRLDKRRARREREADRVESKLARRKANKEHDEDRVETKEDRKTIKKKSKKADKRSAETHKSNLKSFKSSRKDKKKTSKASAKKDRSVAKSTRKSSDYNNSTSVRSLNKLSLAAGAATGVAGAALGGYKLHKYMTSGITAGAYGAAATTTIAFAGAGVAAALIVQEISWKKLAKMVKRGFAKARKSVKKWIKKLYEGTKWLLTGTGRAIKNAVKATAKYLRELFC